MNTGMVSTFFKLAGIFLLTQMLAGCGSSSENDKAETMSLFPTDRLTVVSEMEKMELLDTTKRPYPLEFSNPVQLYAATSPGQPAHHPSDLVGVDDITLIDETSVLVDIPPVYSKALRNAFVQKGGDEELWFAVSLDTAAADKIIWQVTDRPFTLDRENYGSPAGLLASDELAAVDGEFMIDMGHLNPPRLSLVADKPLNAELTFDSRVKPQQDIFHVRAFAVDSEGSVVGDFDRGLQVLFGNRLTYKPPAQTIQMPFDLMSGEKEGEITFGEFGNSLGIATERFYGNDTFSADWYFRPDGFPQQTDTLYIQVSTQQLSSGPDDWRDPPGLVHEIELQKGTPDFDDFSSDAFHAIGVPFSEFGVVPSRYYVRAVALSPGAVAGTVRANYSKPVIVNYAASGETDFIIYPPVQQVTPELPVVKLLEYNPIHWEDPEWMYWYQVVRQPTYKEYTNGFSFSNELVPGLTVGTNIKYEKPSNDDNSWLQDAWDAVSNFFSSLVDYLSKVTNWVSSAYANAKAGLIEFVANNLPLVPQSLRDELEDALTYFVDYGLASVGIPPDLPNFDELTNLGADYLASAALERAGIPENDLINNDTIKDLGNGIKDNLSKSASSGTAPNPLGWNFVRQRPDTLYRPAYMLVEISNPYNYTTPPGKMRGDVFRYLDPDNEVMSGYKTTMIATFGGSLYFELYRPMSGIQIPRLLPGQSLTIPVYLTEYTGEAYPFHPHVVEQKEFGWMYSYFDHFTFSFSINFELPAVDVYAANHGLTSPSGFVYTGTGAGFSFTTDPAYKYVPPELEY